MKKYFTQLLCLFLIGIISPINLYAQVGGFTSYSSSNSSSINLNFTVLRDCAGLEFCAGCVTGSSPTNCHIPVNIRGGVLPSGIPHNIPASSTAFTNNNFMILNLPVIATASGISITENSICSTSICDNCNTRTAGTLTPGIEIYRFGDAVPLSFIPSGACWLSFSYVFGNGRPTSAKSIVANTPFVIETFVNRCLPTPNNSVQLIFDHRVSNCAGQETYLPFKINDPDGDSVVLRLAPIYQAVGTPAIYASPYSAQIPFPHLGAGAPPNPPLGIYIDSKNGWIRYTPQGSFKESIVIEALEWRKVNGIPTLAGITRYDLPIHSENCGNSVPLINVYYDGNLEFQGKTTWNACVDEHEPVCFFIKSKSTNNVPLGTNLVADSSGFFNTIRFANDSLRICLSSTAISNQGNTPYVINLLAKESTCPIIAQKGRTLTINRFVKPNQLLRSKSNGNFNRTLTLESLNNTPINKANTIWQIETAPNSQQYTTIATGDSCIFQFPKAGFYNIRTIVSGACTATLHHILQVENFSIKDSILVQVFCKNNASAKMLAVATGAIGKVQYKLNNGALQDSALFINLAAGNYLLFAQDSAGQKDSIRFTITQPASELTIQSISTTNPNCHGQNTGSIQIVASGGTAPIGFGLNLSNFKSNPLFENLSAGTYLVTVVDNNNCLANDTIDITQPNPLAIDFTIIADRCTNPPSGKITANISGGTQPYFINWLNYQQSGQTEIDKLPSGNYYLRVTDQKNCLSFDTVFVPLSNESFAEQICTINFIESTVASKHEIKWQKTPGKRIASYQVWSAANDTAPYVLRKTILASANSSFIDSINVDDFKSNDIQYKLLTIDSCGRSSAFSKAGSSLVFTTGYDNFGPKLNWEKPNTLAIATSYEIYRRSWLSPTYNLIKTLDSNQFSFIDTNFQVDGLNLTYYVKAIVNNNCQVSEVRSPAKNWTGLSTGKHRAAELGISLFPNPTKQKVNILSKGTASFNTIKIFGLQGNLIQTIELNQATQSYELNLPELAKGMYYISLSNKQNPLISLPLWVE
jgi:hypothetical protein